MIVRFPIAFGYTCMNVVFFGTFFAFLFYREKDVQIQYKAKKWIEKMKKEKVKKALFVRLYVDISFEKGYVRWFLCSFRFFLWCFV